MFKEERRWVLPIIARIIMGSVFLASGVLKAVDVRGTELSVIAYDVTPVSWGKELAIVLIVTEIAVGILAIFGVFTRWVSAVMILMLLVFITGIVMAWARGLSINCGCFGYEPGDGVSTWVNYLWVIIRDIFLIWLCFFMIPDSGNGENTDAMNEELSVV